MAGPGTQLNITNLRGFELISVNTGTAGAAVQLTIGPNDLTIAHLGIQNNDILNTAATPSVSTDCLLVFDIGTDGSQVAPSFNLGVTTNTTGAASQGRKLLIFPNGSADIRGADMFPSQGLAPKKIGLIAIGNGCMVQVIQGSLYGSEA